MKQLTNEERAKIYREAAKRVFENKGAFYGVDAYACHSIANIINAPYGFVNEHTFPELFYLRRFDSWVEYCTFWTTEDYQSRTLGLLLAEQIALNP